MTNNKTKSIETNSNLEDIREKIETEIKGKDARLYPVPFRPGLRN